jgi:hypothetical protein
MNPAVLFRVGVVIVGFLIAASCHRLPVTSPQISTNKLIYLQGEKITVSFSGSSGHRKDFISLSPAGSPDIEAGMYAYIGRGVTQGTLVFDTPPPGKYEARGYYDYSQSGYQVYARSRLEVVPKVVETTPLEKEKTLLPRMSRLEKAYRNILCRQFKSNQEIQEGYSEHIREMQSSMIESLKNRSKFENVYSDVSDREIGGDTLIVEPDVSSIHIVGFWRRGFGPFHRSWIEVDLTFVDGNTREVLGTKRVTSENSPVGAFFSFGATDRSFPSDMGKVLAESIVSVMP